MGVAPPPTHFSLRPQPCRQAPRQDVGADMGPMDAAMAPRSQEATRPPFCSVPALLLKRSAPSRTVPTARWNDPRYQLPQGTTGPGTVKDPIQVLTPPKCSYEIQERSQSS